MGGFLSSPVDPFFMQGCNRVIQTKTINAEVHWDCVFVTKDVDETVMFLQRSIYGIYCFQYLCIDGREEYSRLFYTSAKRYS